MSLRGDSAAHRSGSCPRASAGKLGEKVIRQPRSVRSSMERRSSPVCCRAVRLRKRRTAERVASSSLPASRLPKCVATAARNGAAAKTAPVSARRDSMS
ncbi:hypothetical protein ACM01_03905 [Streptomyces viridochromogenes]|uniref:Uncharacterized protein n=1 Tax=Streptomyces viridochromogenes TaxID=1938 RepID=A0A0J7ZLU0_STRVR|nr:hypothetical protein ACM01_03905 [Streptomyces viridochromogenes]